jgi:hypothetical protein
MHVKNLTKITYLLARKFIKTAADISDPFKGRFEFVDAEEFGLLRESFIFPSQREQFWEEQTRYSFEPRERNVPAYRIYTLKSPVYSYIIPFYEGYTQRYFPGGSDTPVRKQNFGVFGYIQHPLDFPDLIYGTKAAENLYNIGFVVDPVLIFRNARPEHVALVLQTYMDSISDAEKIINSFLKAFDLQRRLDSGERVSLLSDDLESPEIKFFMRNRDIMYFYDRFFSSSSLMGKAFVLSVFEAKLVDLPPQAAAVGYRLIIFLSDYYEQLSKRYFIDYHHDLPAILKLQIAGTINPESFSKRLANDVLWDDLMDAQDLPGINRRLLTWSEKTGNRTVPFDDYWRSKADYVFLHLVKANIDRSKKFIDYLKYMLSPEVPYPAAVEKLPKLSRDEETWISDFERKVETKLNLLRPLIRYSHSIGIALNRGNEAALQYDRDVTVRIMQRLSGLHYISLRDPEKFINREIDADYIARVGSNVYDIIDNSFMYQYRLSKASHRAHILIGRGTLADLANIADIVYRLSLINSSALSSVAAELSTISDRSDINKTARLRMDTRVLPPDISPYVIDFSLLEPRFENLRKMASMAIQVHSRRPGYEFIRLRRGR